MKIKEKDIMWYVKSTIDVIVILIFIICLIGFVSSWFVLIWYKDVANIIMAWSLSIGFVNFLFLVSCDKEWRQDYKDTENVDKFE